MRASKLASTREEIRLRWQKEIHHCGVNDGMLEGQVTVATLQSPACHQTPNANTVGFNRSQRNTWKHLLIIGIPPLLHALFKFALFAYQGGFGRVVAKPLVYGGCSGVDAGAAWHREWHDGAQSGGEPGAF